MVKIYTSGNVDNMAPPSFIILMTLFSLAMVSGIAEARTAPAGEYKNLQGVDKDVAVVEAIENLLHVGSTSFSGENIKDCHTSSNNQDNDNVFVRDFEPRPSATAYPDNAKLVGYQTAFKKDFEPRPSATAYPDDAKLEGYLTAFKKDFEPRPAITGYPDKDADIKKEFVNDFEPRPNLSVYQG